MIDCEPVAAAELRRAFAAERAGTYEYFRRQGVGGGPNFWNEAKDGVNPLTYIRERALQRLVRQKVQQVLMRTHGLWPDISHAAFRDFLATENRRRQSALATGQVIYGPKEYAETGYFDYVFGNALIQLKAKLAENELKATESDLRDFYARTKDRDFNRGPRVEVAQVVVPFGGAVDGAGRESARRRIEEARTMLTGGADFETVAGKINAGGHPIRRSYVERDLTVGKLETDPFARAAFGLQVNQTSGIVERWDGFAIIKQLVRAAADPIPFEECRAEVQLRYTEAHYGEYIDRLAARAKIELIQPVWDQVRPE